MNLQLVACRIWRRWRMMKRGRGRKMESVFSAAATDIEALSNGLRSWRRDTISACITLMCVSMMK
jgi:hypothetical protein